MDLTKRVKLTRQKFRKPKSFSKIALTRYRKKQRNLKIKRINLKKKRQVMKKQRIKVI